MKKALLLLVVLIGIDFFTPTIQTGAQVAIAPVLIAAIVGAIGSMAAAQKSKEASQQAATAAAAGQGGEAGGTIEMTPKGILPSSALDKDKEGQLTALLGNRGGTGAAFKTGGSGMDPNTQAIYNEAMSGFNAPPQSQHQAAIEGANQDPSGGQQPVIGPLATDQGLQPSGEQAPAPENPVPEEASKGFMGDMSSADKIAMAASIGSMLRGPGPPRPPSVGGGGGGRIDMQPVFLNSIYGRGRR